MTAEHPRHRHNVDAARELRMRQTPAEEILWNALRNRRLDGLKFRRQHPIGPFVVDFCCPDSRLAIELDGDVHLVQREHDGERELLLAAAGYTVLRFPNASVHHDLPAVLDAIRAAANSHPPRPLHPLPRTGAW